MNELFKKSLVKGFLGALIFTGISIVLTMMSSVILAGALFKGGKVFSLLGGVAYGLISFFDFLLSIGSWSFSKIVTTFCIPGNQPDICTYLRFNLGIEIVFSFITYGILFSLIVFVYSKYKK